MYQKAIEAKYDSIGILEIIGKQIKKKIEKLKHFLSLMGIKMNFKQIVIE
jgi:hypothetical protein